MKGYPLKECCNGCKRPVQPPSLVLCKECFDALSAKMKALFVKHGVEPVKPGEVGND